MAFSTKCTDIYYLDIYDKCAQFKGAMLGGRVNALNLFLPYASSCPFWNGYDYDQQRNFLQTEVCDL